MTKYEELALLTEISNRLESAQRAVHIHKMYLLMSRSSDSTLTLHQVTRSDARNSLREMDAVIQALGDLG